MDKNYLIAVLSNNDKKVKFLIDSDTSNVACFIARSIFCDVELYRADSSFLLSTFGFFLDKCDSEYEKLIIGDLTKYRNGQLDLKPIEFEFDKELYGFSKRAFIAAVNLEFRFDLA